METYLKTHPWITFRADLREAPAELWMLLGECQSKCEHISGVPLKPAVAKHLNQVYLAKGSLATTAIEGNTLSEEEVLRHLEGKLQLPPSKQYLAQEIDNVVNVCNRLVKELRSGKKVELSVETIREYNRTILTNLQVEDPVIPGEIRKHEVGVSRYKPPPPGECGMLLERLCEWLNGDDFTPKPGMTLVYAIIKSVLAHLYLAWIHPFGDGNGRTARLMEYQILISSGVPTPAAHLLSNHYNETRSEYYRQLDRASKSGGDIIPFLLYAVQGFLDGLKSQLDRIRWQQWDIAWADYVYEAFRHRKGGKARDRRRELILNLSFQAEPVPLNKIPEISPRIAAAYAGKTSKTASRDLNELVEMGLVEKRPDGFSAAMWKILAFLPFRSDEPNHPSTLNEDPRSGFVTLRGE
jgi:Fic family protein